jgi:hypothetical protein
VVRANSHSPAKLAIVILGLCATSEWTGFADDALKEALDLLRGTVTDAAFPPNPKAGVPN